MDDRKERVLALCEKFIKDHRISEESCIGQNDDIILDAYDFIGDICEIVGYYKYPKDE